MLTSSLSHAHNAQPQALKPRDAARSISLDMDNCWGIVRALCDMLLALDEGTYLLVKVRGRVIAAGVN